MMFVLRMAARETRSSWRRLLFFFVCIAVGVGAIVALRSVIQSVREVFGAEARALIAADVLISTSRDWTPAVREVIDRRLRETNALGATDTVETPTMVRPTEGTTVRMVELRAVESAFPLYGVVGLEGGRVYSHALLANQGALVRPELLTALAVSVGDSLVIGKTTFTIRGVITNEPGRRVGDFSLGPRVLVDLADLPGTGLLNFGSRARRVLLVKVAEGGVDPLVTALREDLKDEFVTARSYRAQDDEIGRDFERAENYLSLVGLVIVILGGIAVSSVTTGAVFSGAGSDLTVGILNNRADRERRMADFLRNPANGFPRRHDDDRQYQQRQGQSRGQDALAESELVDEEPQRKQAVNDGRHAGEIGDIDLDGDNFSFRRNTGNVLLDLRDDGLIFSVMQQHHALDEQIFMLRH